VSIKPLFNYIKHNISKLGDLHPMLKLHLGVMLLGVSGLFAKLIQLSATDIIAYRSLLTVFVLFIVLRLSKSKIRLNSFKDYKIALVLGLLAATHWVTYFTSIQMSSVAVGMITLFTYPVFTVLLEPLFRKQRPSLRDILVSVVVSFGISMLFPTLWSSGITLSDDYLIGIVLGLVSAITMALRNIGIQHYFKAYSGTQSMFYQFLVTALILMPFVGTSPIMISVDDWQLLILFTAFFSAAPHVLFASAIHKLSAKTAGLIAYLQPLYGISLGFLLLAEVPTLMTLLGGVIILSAAIYETYLSNKHAKNNEVTQE
jgi:drug/metabolite transporter (DMT)-like permease